MGEAGAAAFWLAVGFASLGLTFGPLGHALARWIESRGGRRLDPDTQTSLERLERRVVELEAMEQRLLEVEERLDFAERMLTSGRPAGAPEADRPPAGPDSAR
jgi:hypothetical protein